MKYEPDFEAELLLLLESDESGEGVSFSRHEFVSKHNYSGNLKEEFLSNHNLDAKTEYHLKRMSEGYLVDIVVETGEWSTFRLTSSGHTRLDEIRNMERSHQLGPKAFGFVSLFSERVLLPVFVGIIILLAGIFIGRFYGTSP